MGRKTKDLAVIATTMNSVRSVINNVMITGVDIDNQTDGGAEFTIYGTSETTDYEAKNGLHHDTKSGTVISGWIVTRKAPLKDTSRLHGPALLERVALDIIHSGLCLQKCSWQVMTVAGRACEQVWVEARVGAFYDPIKERLECAGWERRWHDDSRDWHDESHDRWDVAGASVATRIITSD